MFIVAIDIYNLFRIITVYYDTKCYQDNKPADKRDCLRA